MAGQETQPAADCGSCEEVGAVNDEGAGLRLRAFVGKTSTDFSLSALRFIVAVCSFFGFNVRVLDSLMNAPRISRPWRLRRNCTDVESKLYVLTANPARVAKLRHKE
jgi:hypothetical protein